MKGSFEPRLRQIRRNWCNAWRLGEEHSRCIFQICTPNDACEHRFVCPATGVDLERHVMAALSVCANLFGCGRAKRGRARAGDANLYRYVENAPHLLTDPYGKYSCTFTRMSLSPGPWVARGGGVAGGGGSTNPGPVKTMFTTTIRCRQTATVRWLASCKRTCTMFCWPFTKKWVTGVSKVADREFVTIMPAPGVSVSGPAATWGPVTGIVGVAWYAIDNPTDIRLASSKCAADANGGIMVIPGWNVPTVTKKDVVRIKC